MRCGPFESDAALKAVFVDQRIAFLREKLPTANTIDNRVKFTIELLYEQYNKKKENALVLFLRVLSEQSNSDNICHQNLSQLAIDFESVGKLLSSTSIRSPSGDQKNSTEKIPSIVNSLTEKQMETQVKSNHFTLNLIQRHRKHLSMKSRYARWADSSLDESYIKSIGFTLPLFASPYEEAQGESNELMHWIHSHKRLLILGEPGMGKTVALERAMWEFSTSEDAVIPIFVSLIQYNGDLMDTIRVALNETMVFNFDSVAEVKQLSIDQKCIFLFDGLNEVARRHRDKLHAELASFIRAYPISPCIITSRSQDGLWRRFHSREMIENAVVIHRITDEHVFDYLVAHLGERKGQELYDRLNEALRGLSRTPLLLWLIKEAGIAGEELPGNRGELFDRFVKQVLRRERKHPDLVTIPPTEKLKALGHLAFHLQKDYRLACNREEAIRVIENSQKNTDADLVIEESLRNGLLVGESQVHFMHQAVHEYFVALRLRDLMSSLQISREKTIAKLKIYSSAISLKKRIRKWAKDDWWAEVIVQLAGITDQPMFLAKQVLYSNPWLAYWCSIEGQSISSDIQNRIKQQTVEKLYSPKFEERLRVIRELTRMENPRTIEYLIISLDDESDAVQNLASHTLIRLGQPSINPLLDSLTSVPKRARLAAIRTLGKIWNLQKITDLGSEEIHIRRRAAEALGNMGDDKAVLPLIAVLEDSDEDLRIRTARSLGKLGDSRAVNPLMRALEHTYSRAENRESVIISEALTAIGEPTDEPLLSGIKDPDEEVRHRSLIALGHTWMLPAVTDLASNDPQIRRKAAMELGEIADERAIEPLLAALKDHDQLVRWEATRSLGCIWQFPTLTKLGDTEAKTRCEAAKALGKMTGDRMIEPLIAALRDPDSVVRERAAEALGDLGSISIQPLVSILNYKDRKIRRSIRKVFAKIEDDKVLEVLKSALQDHRWWVRETAAESLVKLGNRGIPILEVALKSDDPDISRLARVVLQRIGTVKAQTVLHFAGPRSFRSK